MGRYRLAAVILGVALMVFGLAAGANAQATGAVRGKLANKTAGGESVAGITVELLSFATSGQRDKRSATVGADGAFSFEGLVTSGTTYIVAAKYKDVTYHGEEIDLSKGETTRNVELAVYDTTTSAPSISVARSHLIVDFDTTKKELVVLEMLVFVNKGDRTYVGGEKKTAEGKPETLRITLPAGARQVEFNEGLNELQSGFVDGAVVDTQPVTPGQRQVVLGYAIPYQGKDASFARKLDYPADRVNLLARDSGAQVTAEGLPNSDVRDMAGTKYVQMTGENIQAGQTISIKFAGIPDNLPNPTTGGKPAATTAAPAGDQTQLAALGIGLVGVGLVLGVAYPVLRRRRTQPAPEESAAGDDDWDSLVEAIADLDDEFEAGNLSEGDYHRRRAEMKRQLQQMSRQPERA